MHSQEPDVDVRVTESTIDPGRSGPQTNPLGKILSGKTSWGTR